MNNAAIRQAQPPARADWRRWARLIGSNFLLRRLAKALLRLAIPASGLKAQLEIHLSQRELGGIVGATRESVNKCLREWQQAGVVRVEGAVIKINDREAVEEVADLGIETGRGYAPRHCRAPIPEIRVGVERERNDFHLERVSRPSRLRARYGLTAAEHQNATAVPGRAKG